MNTIEKNCIVEIDFTLTTNAGEMIDSSKDEGPLEYIHGHKRITPQLEDELEGKKVGEQFSFSVKPEDAYGLRDDSLVQFAQKELFGENFDKIEVGMPLEVGGPNGEQAIVTAVDIREDGILLDGNHPLAGQTLNFDVTVLSLRAATEEEIAEITKSCTKPDCC